MLIFSLSPVMQMPLPLTINVLSLMSFVTNGEFPTQYLIWNVSEPKSGILRTSFRYLFVALSESSLSYLLSFSKYSSFVFLSHLNHDGMSLARFKSPSFKTSEIDLACTYLETIASSNARSNEIDVLLFIM